MLLICDSGSTKAAWAVIDTNTRELVDRFTTSGINPINMTDEAIVSCLSEELRPELADLSREVKRVEMFCAGCVPQVAERLQQLVSEAVGGKPKVIAQSDMVCAARALLGTRPGVAAILGTGSNSCFYNGKEIVMNTPALGYILDDEGSGSAIGKALVFNVLKRLFPEELCQTFYKETSLSKADIIRGVYKDAAPKRFLASLAPFVSRNIDRWSELEQMVVDGFDRFITHNFAEYPKGVPVAFTGSIAVHFRPQLEKAARRHNFPELKVGADPIEGLIEFYTR